MNRHDLRSLLEVSLEAARRAGDAILEVYNAAGGFDVREKADRSPVTLADERAEATILEMLTKAAPDIPAVAEENCERLGVPGHAAARFWLIDPLDGTKEFLKRNGEFTVNIALVEDDCPALGVVHAPALGLTYAAAGPGTATRDLGSGTPQSISARAVPSRGAVVMHSRSHENNDAFARYLATLDSPEARVSGSSIKFCLLAAGEADLYPRFGPTMEWDTAAGQAILEAAGGTVVKFDGTPFRYAKPGFCNPGFLARGRT